MKRAPLNPEEPDGPYRIEFDSEEERETWRKENAEKQKQYRAKRRRWCKSINFPWPKRNDEEDLDPPPGTLEIIDPENG